MNPDNHIENNIPTLTDVIAKSVREEAIPIPPIQTHVNPNHDLGQLEKSIHENVLNQLLNRVDFVLEHRLRDSLADVLDKTVAGLANDIRQGLSKSLEEVIQRAISQELSKVRSAKTRN